MDATYISDDCEQLPISGAPQAQDYSDLYFIRGVVIGLALSLGIWACIVVAVISALRAIG